MSAEALENLKAKNVNEAIATKLSGKFILFPYILYFHLSILSYV